jgi:uroporphyrinogen decarboxylase
MENRFRRALALEANDRIPFVPAVFEHKAWFIGRTPSEVCRDSSLLVSSVLAEFEALKPDAIVVGMDVYNVEAEACGCGVTYFPAPDASIPALEPGAEAIREGMSPGELTIPDPNASGRMTIMLDATEEVFRRIGREVEVMGVMSGPFSLAAALMGPAGLFLAMASEPDRAREVIAFATSVVIAFGKAFASRGLTAALFDSQASPQLISPRSYREFAFEPTRRVIQELMRAGMTHVPLVIGGNTDPILDSYAGTGGNYLLCDGGASVRKFVEVCQASKCAFRRNIPSDFLLNTSVDEIHRRVRDEVAAAGRYPGFIMGTGVVPYGIPTEKILAVAEGLG